MHRLELEAMAFAARNILARRLVRDVDRTLEISVIFTSFPATLAALRVASELALGLEARITLLVPHVVPYPKVLERTPSEREFHENRLRAIAEQSPLETDVQICLCRDPFEALQALLPPASVVVVAGPKRLWPTKERMLASRLRRCGHGVVFKQTR
jgi:hypothetical protein